ncbi:peptidase M16 [Streptosporangium violaceochromogenes]|nr:peptidase M16 [Streptosporangium violaceochromogenes]
MSGADGRALPGPAAPLTLPAWTETTLPGGPSVVAVVRRAAPLVELRLRVPAATVDLAAGTLLARTLFSGTGTRPVTEITEGPRAAAGTFTCTARPDRWLIGGTCLASGLGEALGVLADALCGAAYPDREVSVERERLADQVRVALSQPSHMARAELLRRFYGDHPYGVETPGPERVNAVGAEELRSLHERRMRPGGATLVLVGDLDPDDAVALVSDRLGAWTGGAEAGEIRMPAAPPPPPRPLLLVDRPGAAQSSMRLAMSAPARDHPDNAPLQLANLIFGGSPSRWTENIREKKGYSYGPSAVIEHAPGGSAVMLSANVATEVTAPALLETFYELGRIATLPPDPAEVERARQHAVGTLRLLTATQAGLAQAAGTLAGSGLGLGHLKLHAERLASATAGDVHRAAATYLGPGRSVSVVLGDADRIGRGLAAVTQVEIGQGPAT